MIFLREDTASQELVIGPFLDDTDGKTAETGLTIANTDIRLFKEGASTFANKNSGGGSHLEDGYYLITLDATDTDTAGKLIMQIVVAGALPVRVEATVLPTQVYDSFVLGSDALQVDAIQISGDATAADNLEATYDGTGYTDNYAPAQQQQLNNLAVGSAAISVVAESFTQSTGTVAAGTYASTHQRDGVYHQLQDSAGTLDAYYQFDVTGNGVPVSITTYVQNTGGNDPIRVEGYNWGTTSWEQVGTIPGQNVASPRELTFSLYTTHVGTGANIGKVRVRFYNTGLTTANLYIDQLYVNYAVVSLSVGYALGAIWIDTVNGTAGTTAFVNGVADNPVSTLADALTLSTALNINKFQISNGSSITLAATTQNKGFYGDNWTLALGGQDIAGSHFQGASVSGVGTGSGFDFHDCTMGVVTIADGDLFCCGIAGSITLSAAGTYYFENCFSGVAGTSTPTVDFGAAVGNTNLNMRHYSGGIEVLNIGRSGTDNMSLEGWGQIRLNANCVGGTIAIRGNFTVTDNAGGVVTLSDKARYDVDKVSDGVWAAATRSLTDKDGFTLSTAGIDAIIDEVLTDIADETEIASGASITLRKAVRAVFNRFFRTVTQTETEQVVKNDSDGADIATMTVSDDGTTQTKGGI